MINFIRSILNKLERNENSICLHLSDAGNPAIIFSQLFQTRKHKKKHVKKINGLLPVFLQNSSIKD